MVNIMSSYKLAEFLDLVCSSRCSSTFLLFLVAEAAQDTVVVDILTSSVECFLLRQCSCSQFVQTASQPTCRDRTERIGLSCVSLICSDLVKRCIFSNFVNVESYILSPFDKDFVHFFKPPSKQEIQGDTIASHKKAPPCLVAIKSNVAGLEHGHIGNINVC